MPAGNWMLAPALADATASRKEQSESQIPSSVSSVFVTLMISSCAALPDSGVGVEVRTAVATGLVAGWADATWTGVGEEALLACAVGNGGLATRPKIGVCVGRLAEDRTNLTITEWLTFMLILAVLPATSKTGPSHLSTSQPG